MAVYGLQQPAWRKSTASANSDCVEVAFGDDGRIMVRDSKDPSGPRLCFVPSEWAAFISGVKAGEFDVTARRDATQR